jgi:hypothetical protein
MSDPLLLLQLDLGDGRPRAARMQGDGVAPARADVSVLDLAAQAIATGTGLADRVAATDWGPAMPWAEAEAHLLAPVTHPDPAHLHGTGTGLTHLGSADARNKMHAATGAEVTDSIRMFRQGIEGGRPDGAAPGVQPEWFYKGNGHAMVAPGADLRSPGFALDGGEEPEIAGVYLIGPDGTPHRLGFALANEFSDHVTERQNYLLLAHSKLRDFAIGPCLRVGPLPADVQGRSRILRDGAELWSGPFASGEANMSHSLANLEHHHFKYDLFRVPGDVHVHMFGTSTLSFAAGVRTQPGDIFEISARGFGPALRNRLAQAPAQPHRMAVAAL